MIKLLLFEDVVPDELSCCDVAVLWLALVIAPEFDEVDVDVGVDVDC